MEERSRRINTRIDGIAEKKGKALDEYQEQVQELLLEKLNLNIIKIDGTTDSKFSDTNIIKYLKIQINWKEAISKLNITLVKQHWKKEKIYRKR